MFKITTKPNGRALLSDNNTVSMNVRKRLFTPLDIISNQTCIYTWLPSRFETETGSSIYVRHLRFQAAAQNFNYVTNNIPRFQANSEELDILFN